MLLFLLVIVFVVGYINKSTMSQKAIAPEVFVQTTSAIDGPGDESKLIS